MLGWAVLGWARGLLSLRAYRVACCGVGAGLGVPGDLSRVLRAPGPVPAVSCGFLARPCGMPSRADVEKGLKKGRKIEKKN